jgi:hypothetical protein
VNNNDVSSKIDRVAEARAAWRLSNDLKQDLIAGTQAYWIFQRQLVAKPAREPVPTAIRRLCLSHLVIALAKWSELYRRYRRVISRIVIKQAKMLAREIESRGVVEFRNKVAGHVWDEKAKRALTVQEVEDRLNAVLRDSVDDFLLWVNDPNGSNKNTVVGIIESIHAQIQNEHGFRENDLFL